MGMSLEPRQACRSISSFRHLSGFSHPDTSPRTANAIRVIQNRFGKFLAVTPCAMRLSPRDEGKEFLPSIRYRANE